MFASSKRADDSPSHVLYRSRGIQSLLQGNQPDNPAVVALSAMQDSFRVIAQAHQNHWPGRVRRLPYTTQRPDAGRILALNGRVSNADLFQLSTRLTDYLHSPFGPFTWVRSRRPMLPAVPFIDETVGMDTVSETTTSSTTATIFYETQPSVTLGQVVISYLAAARQEFIDNPDAQASGVARFTNQVLSRDRELVLLGMGVTPLDQLHLRAMVREERRENWAEWMEGNIQLRDPSLISEIIRILDRS